MTTTPTYNFDTLLQTAQKKKWCVEYICTTCGSRDFRNEVERFLKEDRQEFLKSLYDYDFEQIESYDKFTTAIYLVFYHLRLTGEQSKILLHWIERNNLPIRLADYILYHIARYSMNQQVKEKWLTKCLEFAISNHDTSLTETLLLSLKQEASNYPELLKLASDFSKSSNKIKNILTKFSLTTI